MAITECKELKLISPLLKTWSFKENITKCKTSPCGNFLAVKGNTILSIIHMTLEYQNDLKAKYTDFIWALCSLNKESLLVATETWFLITIDNESNLEWHSIFRNHKKKIQHKLVKSIDVKTLLKISENDVSLLCAEYDKACIQQRITCIINKSLVVVITTLSNQKESSLQSSYSIDCLFVQWQSSERFLYLLQEDFFVQILDKQSLNLHQTIDMKGMKDSLNFKAVHFGVINDMSLFVFYSNNSFHFYPLSWESDESASTKLHTVESNIGEWKTRLHQTAKLSQNESSNLFTASSFCAPQWINELDIVSIHVSKSIVLLHCRKSADQFLIKYDCRENEFTFCKIQSDVSLSFGEGNMVPILFVSASQVMLPFFAVSQEDLIDKVIQFSNISMAEKICKANEWDQFSIPLYTLEVGLRHRQLDTIDIFLKSRDKPFTRYWKQCSFKVNSNLVSIESDELKETIIKLQNSITTASKSKQKDNFFEGLLMVTICYINNLIQDGIEALKSLPVFSEKRNKSTNQSTDFNFFEDLHKTLNYLAQVVVNLRKYLKVSFKDDPQTDFIDGGRQHQFDSRNLLINGKVGTWQKNLIFQENDAEKGCLDSAIAKGKLIAQEMLVQNNIDAAEKILTNMGLEPNRELKSIYFETSMTSLRGFMFSMLKKKGLLEERDTDDFKFLKEMEKYYITGDQDKFEFTLKQVREWNILSRKRIVFDGIFLSNAKETIDVEDEDVLWDYLISHNHISIIQHWLLGDKCKQIFPLFNIRGKELLGLPGYMEKRLLNFLVKNGYYPQYLINNFLHLLEYLGKNDLIFSSHPFEYYKYQISDEKRKSLVNDFNYNFCQFCQENNLPVLMWRFITFYNLHLLNVKFPYKVSSWLTLMFSIYEYVHSPGQNLISGILIQNLSLKDQSSEVFNCLVKNNQVLLVLSTILVSGKSLEQVIEGNDGILKIDKQLLVDSLQSYPKLLNSIQSKSSESNVLNITIYQLLQDNTEIDVFRWFAWQEGNKLALKEGLCEEVLLDLPHFSHPLLVSNYAQVVKLDYEYYLKEGRPMYAYLIFKKENSCLASACKIAYKLAIENFKLLSVVSSCCFFMELLNQENDMIKLDAKVLDLLFKSQNKLLSLHKKYSSEELVDLFMEKKNYLEILRLLEDSIEQLINENNVEKFSYKAVWYWQLAVDFCRVHLLPITVRYLENCCDVDNWLQFVLFIHVHQVPSSEAVLALNKMKNQTLKEHLIAIVNSTKQVSIEKERKRRKHQSYTKKRDVRAQFYSRIGASANREPMTSSPENTASNEKNEELCDTKRQQKKEHFTPQRLQDIASFSGGLLDTLLECEKHAEPWKALLRSSHVSYHAFLPILAACYKEASRLECICSWYLCNMDDQDRTAIIKKLQNELNGDVFDSQIFNRVWKTEDLLIIIKEMLLFTVKYGNIPSQGFQIFMKDHILVPFLQCMESFLNRHEHSNSVTLLSSFQSDFGLIQQTINKKSFLYDITAENLEVFTQECINIMVSTCKTQLDVKTLVNIIVESKYGYKFSKKVLDFNLIKEAVHIIYNSNIDYELQNLFTYDADKFDKETKLVFTMLLQNQAFEQARHFAELFKLPLADDVLISEVKEELNHLQKSNSWSDVHIRKSFWKAIDLKLFEKKCAPLVAGFFFEQQANSDSFSFGEKASLFMYSLKWYSFNNSVAANRLFMLDKLMWFYKIKSLVEIPKKMEAINEFSKEQSFIIWHTSIGEHDLEQEDSNDSVTFDFSEQEENAYHEFVNCLLDHDFVAEALRIAILFKRNSIHLDIVKTCMMLAQGKLNVESVSNNVKAILASTTSNHISASSLFDVSTSFSRTASISSINSNSAPFGEMHDFVFIEEIHNALEKLTLRAKHGKKICQKELLIFKIAGTLQLTYDEIVSQDKFYTLKKLLDSGFDKRKQLSKLFINLFSLENTEVVTFVADSMISMIKISCGIETDTRQSDNMKLPSFDDIVSLLQLTSLPSCVGKKILNEAHEVSRGLNDNRGVNEIRPKNWRYLVDLLIYAHHCVTICCDMEGIAGILKAARISTKLLAVGQQYNLLVRLLTHVGRFKEMFYVIETLYNHHHFETLCRKGILNEGKLKQALIDFMLTYHKDDKENFDLILVGFGMYREYAEQLQTQAENKIKVVQEKLKAGYTKEVVYDLKDIQQSLSYAADYFQKDDCQHYAHKCLQTARLIELQIYLLPSAKCILGLSIQDVKQFLNHHENFLEAFLVAETYGLHDSSIWVDPLYEIVLSKDNPNISYLQQFNCYQFLSKTIVTELALKARLNKSAVAISNMRKILTFVRDIKVKLKIFKELGFTDMEKSLNESSAGAFLRDQMFYM